MKELFRFKVTKDTLTAVIAGIVMIGLSLLMLPFSGETKFDALESYTVEYDK